MVRSLTALPPSLAVENDEWTKEPKYVRDLDKGWMAQWMVTHDSRVSEVGKAITREALDILSVTDNSIIANLFQVFTMTSPYTELPQPCRESKALTAVVFSRRAQQVGGLMQGWRARHVGPGNNGQINMQTGCP